jgi:hypothetical protein
MNTRNEIRESRRYSGKTGVSLVCFIYLFLGNAKCAAALPGPADSVKIKYDITDPRNPDCPCHKYQKLAEKEFKRISEEKRDESLAVHTIAKNKMINKSLKVRREKFSFRKNNHTKNTFNRTRRKSPNFKRLFKKDISSCQN